MPAPVQVMAIGGPPSYPGRLTTPQAQIASGGGTGGYKAVALTDGVYIAPASPAMTDAPLWVNISEPGTWNT